MNVLTLLKGFPCMYVELLEFVGLARYPILIVTLYKLQSNFM
jgi:hypothetical protein